MGMHRQFSHCRRKGVALIVAMIFVVIFSGLAVSMAAISGLNLQISDNQQRASTALTAGLSGLEILRYHLSNVVVSGMIAPADRLPAVVTSANNNLQTAGITNITFNYNAASDTITIPAVILDSQTNKTFSAIIFQLDDENIRIYITGNGKNFTKTIRVDFEYRPIGHSVFDYGMATKGPLHMTGNVDIEGLNHDVEASIYIESLNDIVGLIAQGKSSGN